VGVRFSIVYPTRHRPAFIRQALQTLASQGYDNFEVIVSDNFVDPSLSCEDICRQSAALELTYVRPPQPVGMVENWDFSLPFATGDYVCYLTDKMFVLPGALRRVDEAIRAADGPDIVSWVGDTYYPQSYGDYFGAGEYWPAEPGAPASVAYEPFSPAADLDRRGTADVARTEQTSSEYSRGKIAFGAYRRDLVDRIAGRYSGLFHNIAPDYTSMVLGLSEARDAIEMSSSCVVSVITDISTGMLSDTSDEAALAFLDSLEGGARAILPDLLVPGVYASQHNIVAHDYRSLKYAFDLPFAFEPLNWLAYCWEDLHRPSRVWSSPRVESEQKGLLEAYLVSIDPADSAEVRVRVAERAAAAEARVAEAARIAAEPPRTRPLHRRMLRRLIPKAPARGPTPFPSIQAAVGHVGGDET
jgi:hypothetical protein